VDENNVFASNAMPEIRIKISSEFKYIGKDDTPGIRADYHNRGVNEAWERFFFATSNNCRGISIIFSRRTMPRKIHLYLTDPNPNEVIDYGMEDLPDGTYRYEIFIDNDGEDSYLIKRITRHTGTTNNILTGIAYLERVQGTWDDPKHLSPEQQARLEVFKINWQTAFTILKP
jgi:hypothetical protein